MEYKLQLRVIRDEAGGRVAYKICISVWIVLKVAFREGRDPFSE